MGLFSNMSGRFAEDIATEVISHLLSIEHGSVPFQKLFFNRILSKPLTSDQLAVEIITQATFDRGRPDLVILGSTATIIIETKLGAYLSGDDQLIRYCDVYKPENFKTTFPFQQLTDRRYLAILAPRSTIELSMETSNKRCLKEHGQTFEKWLEDHKINFIKLPWEEVITDLDTRDRLQEELKILVSEFINQELEKGEIMLLKNTEIPTALTKLFNRDCSEKTQKHMKNKEKLDIF